MVVAGLSGDSGKTLVSLGLAAAWARQGWKVAPFKKGPDYIDAAWMTLAAKRPCRNLDTFLMDGHTIRDTFRRECARADIAVIEGNRGLHDGMDAEGSHSTATLATLVRAPVLLVVDATKMTRTAAALVLGAKLLDPEVHLLGVVLNRVGGARHARVAREAIERHVGVPVIGAIPRQTSGELIPGRHLGLVTTDEHPEAMDAVEAARKIVEEHLDLVNLYHLAAQYRDGVGVERETASAPGGEEWSGNAAHGEGDGGKRGDPLRIGVVRDAAFPFYYPENLEALEARGAHIVNVSALEDPALPEGLHALYIGGGFPETHARRLAKNLPFLTSVRRAAEQGLPIYAECGGLMLLTESIEYEGRTAPMAGVLPVSVRWSVKPAGHGYAHGTVDAPNPFYPVGTPLRGHEFHHSVVAPGESDLPVTAVALNKGAGVGGKRDGFVTGNVMALYVHVHAAGLPVWADGMVRAAQNYREAREVTE